MNVNSFNEQDAVKSYLKLMLEFRTRHEIVVAALDGKMPLSPPYAREYCYFQLRRLCEITALGCLSLHGNIKDVQSNSARNEWNAHKIMRLLGNKYAHFFPQSATIATDGKMHHLNANSVEGALTRDDFWRLYAKCGEVLHRGSIKSFENERPLTKSDYDELMEFHNSFIKLMNQHIITRSTGDSMFLISLLTPSGSPECSILNFDMDRSTIQIQRYDVKID